jgi:hypothetical protein
VNILKDSAEVNVITESAVPLATRVPLFAPVPIENRAPFLNFIVFPASIVNLLPGELNILTVPSIIYGTSTYCHFFEYSWLKSPPFTRIGLPTIVLFLPIVLNLSGTVVQI